MLCCGKKLRRRGAAKSTRMKDDEKDSDNNNNLNQNDQQQQQQALDHEDEVKVSQFVTDMLDRHNQYRQHHGVQSLQHSQDLTEDAQTWANKLAEIDKLQHDSTCHTKRVGENVAMKYSSAHTNFPGSAFVDSWYSEAHDYKFDGTEDQIECGHFTQVVWKSTKEAGFGKAISKSNKVYVVGRYRPAGNYTGDFNRNVLPPKDGKVLELTTASDKANKENARNDNVVPVIGPDKPGDVMVETQTVTKTVGAKKIVKVTETYRTPTGSRYTKTKESTMWTS